MIRDLGETDLAQLETLRRGLAIHLEDVWLDHGTPWRAEPRKSGSGWRVLDAHGRVVADRLTEATADLIAWLTELSEELNLLGDPEWPGNDETEETDDGE